MGQREILTLGIASLKAFVVLADIPDLVCHPYHQPLNCLHPPMTPTPHICTARISLVCLQAPLRDESHKRELIIVRAVRFSCIHRTWDVPSMR